MARLQKHTLLLDEEELCAVRPAFSISEPPGRMTLDGEPLDFAPERPLAEQTDMEQLFRPCFYELHRCIEDHWEKLQPHKRGAEPETSKSKSRLTASVPIAGLTGQAFFFALGEEVKRLEALLAEKGNPCCGCRRHTAKNHLDILSRILLLMPCTPTKQ